jgi:integrase
LSILSSSWRSGSSSNSPRGWSWIDYDNRRVVWLDSKTGGMSKPMSAEAQRLFETAPILEESPFVCPSVFDLNQPMSKHTYYQGWRRILERAGLPHTERMASGIARRPTSPTPASP